MDRHELEPLEAGPSIRLPPLRQSIRTSSTCYRAPIRVVRLLALLIVLPTLFILVPLYMRYRVFQSQMYPMSMTDMRLIDGKVSPTWCQRQVVRSNSTFNAFVVPGNPEIARDLVPVTMTRQMVLKADMKEYWGFYLLAGSSVTVSTCVRRPGASLIMIKGYKHLQSCAYIGDDSSEEVDELLEAEKLGLLDHETLVQKLKELKKMDGKANQPDAMQRHNAGVSFHDKSRDENATLTNTASDPSNDITDHDPKELSEILEHLHAIKEAIKQKASANFKLPDHLVPIAALHRFRDTNVDRNEQKFLIFKDIDPDRSSDNISKEVIYNEENRRLAATAKSNENDTQIDLVINSIIENHDTENDTSIKDAKNTTENTAVISKIATTTTESIVKASVHEKLNHANDELNKVDNEDLVKIEEEADGDEKVEPDADLDSKEIFEDVLKKLQALGARGQRVLVKLQKSMGLKPNKKKKYVEESEIMSQMKGSSEELDHLRRVLVEAIDEERNYKPKMEKTAEDNASNQNRSRREIVLGAGEFARMLNEDDEARDYAAEEGLEPDGFAEHHTKLNETSPLDMSNSEYWSSFSSSEEALLECEGLILNLPLTPHPRCEETYSEEVRVKAASRNALTYKVPANGYYFFVFNSENEVQDNFINVRFDLQKTRYDVARTALRECRNSTARCDLALDIFSSQKVILELPLRNNDSLWNEQFVVVSECEPRTSIYLFCVLTAPFLIMLFAFQ